MTSRRLVIDIQASQDVRNGDRGLGRAAYELAAALLHRPGALAAVLLNPQLPIPSHLPPELLESPLLAWNTAAALDAARAEGPIAYHLASPFEFSTPGPVAIPAHAVADEATAIVCTVHDFIPLHEPDRLLPGQKRRRYHQRLELIRGADLLVFDSAHIRDEAVSLLGVNPRRCAVVGLGASQRFRPREPGDDPWERLRRALPQLRRPYALMVSGGDERKNTEGLIAAWSRLPAELRRAHQLVVACDLAPGIEQAWRGCAASAGLRGDELVLTGFVPDSVLVALYQATALTVMPSFSEGFGLPVAESIACGAPVITSSTTSLPEILDLPESTFDPTDVDAMARAVERGLTDDAFRERLLAAGRGAEPAVRWDPVVDRLLAAVAGLDGAVARVRVGERRPRIALVGPLPPPMNGVGDYNARVCAELGLRADLDVFVTGDTVDAVRVPPGPYRSFAAGALGRSLNPAAYDAVVYTFGNSEHHLQTFDLLHRFPGIVWLHDVRLGGFYRNYAHEHSDDPEQWMRDVLSASYGGVVPDVEEQLDPFNRAWQDLRGIFLTREIVRHARAVLVNSRFAAQLVRLDQGPDARIPPVVVMPFGSGSPPIDVGPVERDADPPVIASFGIVDWIKAPDVLLESFARVRRRVPARLVFVGPFWAPHHAELMGTARRLGVEALVSATDTVSLEDWSRWMRRASVVVQLRRMTNGEMSGAIRSAQEAGTPVVTNMVNARLDFPAGSVLPIDARLIGGELDEALVALLSDPVRWRAQSCAGREHVATQTFAHVVDALLAAIRAHPVEAWA